MMENGRIIEHGTHEELLEKGGYYASVYEHQYPMSKESERKGVMQCG